MQHAGHDAIRTAPERASRITAAAHSRHDEQGRQADGTDLRGLLGHTLLLSEFDIPRSRESRTTEPTKQAICRMSSEFLD
jgi:hypothetical protein